MATLEVKSPEEQIEELRDISEAIEDYMARSLYINDFGADTDYNINDILRQCYALALEELAEYGIGFNVSDGDLLGDWYTARHITLILQLIKGSKLTTLLSRRDDLDKLTTLLDNESELEESEDPFIIFLRFVFSTEDPQDPLVQAYFYIGSMVVTTQTFKDYLRYCINKFKTEGEDTIVPDIDRASEYIAKVERKREALRTAYDLIKSTDTDLARILATPVARVLLERYNLDKVSADNLRQYSILDWDNINPSLTRQRDRIRYEHRVQQPHHIEYWLDKGKIPAPQLKDEHAIILVLHLFYVGIDASEFNSRVVGLKRKLAFKLSDTQKAIIDRVADIVSLQLIPKYN